MASIKAKEIAARVWCDQEMREVQMNTEAALKIAEIIDEVLKSEVKEDSLQLELFESI